MNSNFFKASFLSCAMLVAFGSAFADNLNQKSFEDRIPIPAEEVPQQIVADDCDGVGFNVSAGVPTWFFDSESSHTGAGLYGDIRPKCSPLNVRLGIEGRHVDFYQPAALAAAEFPGKTPEFTFIRIPLSIEYAHDITENTHWFAGLGPDLIRVANDVQEWDVGFHLSTRVQYDLTDSLNLGVEGGYMWNDVDGPATDIELDTFYVTPQIGFSF